MIQDAQGWCTGMTLRDGMGREVGGRVRLGDDCTPMADSCQCMAKPIQYCKVISLQLNKFKKYLLLLLGPYHFCPLLCPLSEATPKKDG